MKVAKFTKGKKHGAYSPSMLTHDSTYNSNFWWQHQIGPTNIKLKLTTRLIKNDLICLCVDPEPYINKQMRLHCEQNLGYWNSQTVNASNWEMEKWYNFIYARACKEYRRTISDHIMNVNNWSINGATPNSLYAWSSSVEGKHMQALPPPEGETQCYRSYEIDDNRHSRGSSKTGAPHMVYFIYLSLSSSLQNDTTYEIKDGLGNSDTFIYNDISSQSWALKVNQVGYINEASKYAYLGMWQGTGGDVDFDSFLNDDFYLRKVSDDSIAFTGSVTLDKADYQNGGIWTNGEGNVYQCDFSSYTVIGEYYIHIPNIGKSWTFKIDSASNILGDPFYICSKGMYHQRCVALTTPYTNWTRGDDHQTTYVANWQSWNEAYNDHSADGWGFRLRGTSTYANISVFDCVEDTATETVATNVKGGWHDAGDHDRRPQHLEAVCNLCMAYIMYPSNFTDNQLNIPESGDGSPDILSEAEFGLEVWRQAQLYFNNGSVADGIEARRHPFRGPDEDEDRHYLSFPDRMASLRYAEASAMLAYCFGVAGLTSKKTLWNDSAEDAYDWAITNRAHVEITVNSVDVDYDDPPDTADEYKEWKFQAEVALLASTENTTKYKTPLETQESIDHWASVCSNLDWATKVYEVVLPVLNESTYPSSWISASSSLQSRANYWLTEQSYNPYRRLWYRPSNSYYTSQQYWGNHNWNKHLEVLLAYRVTGTASYKTLLLESVDYNLGCNPRGRVWTTGLGQHSVSRLLNHQTWEDQENSIYDPPMGITIYGNTCVASSHMCGNGGWRHGGYSYSYMNQYFDGYMDLPYPYDNDVMLTQAETNAWIAERLPYDRRMTQIELEEVAKCEFTVWETIAKSVVVLGCLMGTGYSPSDTTKNRTPKTYEENYNNLIGMP